MNMKNMNKKIKCTICFRNSSFVEMEISDEDKSKIESGFKEYMMSGDNIIITPYFIIKISDISAIIYDEVDKVV